MPVQAHTSAIELGAYTNQERLRRYDVDATALLEAHSMRFVFAAAAVAAATALAMPMFVLAQGPPQTVQLTKLDVVKVATGYRASKVIGSSVVNEANDTVGKVDDIIIGEDGKSPFVVLSVGGFLGMGDRLEHRA
jgi:PRC-barrel domain protein